MTEFSGYLEPSEVRVIIDTVERVSAHPERDQLLLEVLWQTGARVTEALLVKRGNVSETSILLRNLKQMKIIRNEEGKPTRILDKNADKEVEVSKDLCDKLKEFCQRNHFGKDDFIFRANVGTGHLSRWYVWWLLQKISGVSGIDRFGKRRPVKGRRYSLYPHLFRHSNAMYLLENTADIKLVQQQLGHKNVSTTQIYAYTKRPKIRKEIAKIEW